MSVTIYGIKNCDTMKKAFTWLAEHGIAYDFHDYRKAGVSAETLAAWCDALGWQALVNTRGTTWRKLAADRQACASTEEAVALMAEHPNLIRRPVLVTAGGTLLAGFDAERYATALGRGGDTA